MDFHVVDVSTLDNVHPGFLSKTRPVGMVGEVAKFESPMECLIFTDKTPMPYMRVLASQ